MSTHKWQRSSLYEWLVSTMFFWLFLASLEIIVAVILNTFPTPLKISSIPSVIDIRSFIAALSIYAPLSIPIGLILFTFEKVFSWLKEKTKTSFFHLNRMDFFLLLGWELLFFKLISNLIPFLKIPYIPYIIILPLLLLQMWLSGFLKNKRMYYQLQWILIATVTVFLSKTAFDMLIISSSSVFVRLCVFMVFVAGAFFIGLSFNSLLYRIIVNRIKLRPAYGLLCIILLSTGVLYTLNAFNTVNYSFPHPQKSITFHKYKNEIAKNVIIFVVDCLRTDHLGCYGYTKNTSPFLDKIAQSGVIFENCISPSSWTVPSVVSLFTGVYPKQHGVHESGIIIPRGLPTLQDLLKKQGITTAAFVTNVFLQPNFGYANGFHYYFDHYLQHDFKEYVASRLFFFNALLHFKNLVLYSRNLPVWWSFGVPPENHEKKCAERVTNDVLEWIQSHHAKPFYIYVHYMDVHGPYDGRWYPLYNSKIYPSQNLRGKLMNIYDGKITYVDKQIYRIWKYLSESNLSENTLLIITADHGQELYDHKRIGHCHTLYEELIKVPLIIVNNYLPEMGKRIKNQVQLIDLPMTVLDFLKIEANEYFVGQSLLPLIVNHPHRDELSYALSHTIKGRKFIKTKKAAGLWVMNEKVTLQSLRVNNRWKIIIGDDGRTELYNLEKDAKEHNNLRKIKRHRVKVLKKKLMEESSKLKSFVPQKEKKQLSPDTRNKLRALGYLN